MATSKKNLVLSKLKRKHKTGVDVWDFPTGFRLAAYIGFLRDDGHIIETRRYHNLGGKGTHANYLLKHESY